MLAIAGIGLSLTACTEKKSEFKYSIDQFADIEILKYEIPGWDELTLQQKEYIYHLSEAAKCGRDIIWDQNFKYNLRIRHILEDIIEKYDGERSGDEWNNFLVYAKRVFFSNGIHHHYGNEKFIPECTSEYFTSLMETVGVEAEESDLLMHVIYDADLYTYRQYPGSDKDLVTASCVNLYDGGITADEVNAFYAGKLDASDPHPVSYGLNSRLVKENGVITEQVYKADGLYGPALQAIIGHLEAAAAVAENDLQKDRKSVV